MGYQTGQIEAGLLLRGDFRRNFEQLQFRFPDHFSFIESKGLLSSEFIYRVQDNPTLFEAVTAWVQRILDDQEELQRQMEETREETRKRKEASWHYRLYRWMGYV